MVSRLAGARGLELGWWRVVAQRQWWCAERSGQVVKLIAAVRYSSGALPTDERQGAGHPRAGKDWGVESVAGERSGRRTGQRKRQTLSADRSSPIRRQALVPGSWAWAGERKAPCGLRS